jgi:hypothetical protein
MLKLGMNLYELRLPFGGLFFTEMFAINKNQSAVVKANFRKI